jgi:hypothetical protein
VDLGQEHLSQNYQYRFDLGNTRSIGLPFGLQRIQFPGCFDFVMGELTLSYWVYVCGIHT